MAMRALTNEEVQWVAGGDATGDRMKSAGETIIIWAPAVSMIPKYGSNISKGMLLVGGALVAQGNKWNQDHPGGGGTSGGTGGGPGPTGGGGTNPNPDPGNHGGVGGGTTTCSDGDDGGNGTLPTMTCTGH